MAVKHAGSSCDLQRKGEHDSEIAWAILHQLRLPMQPLNGFLYFEEAPPTMGRLCSIPFLKDYPMQFLREAITIIDNQQIHFLCAYCNTHHDFTIAINRLMRVDPQVPENCV